MIAVADASIAVRFVKVEDFISWRHSAGGSVSFLCEGHISSLVCNHSGPRNHTGLSFSFDACVPLTGYWLDFLFPDNDSLMREVRKT